MSTLILRLAGPLQSWGSESRFVERKTRHEPTKSGVVGLLASALGRCRTDDIDDLARHLYGVRLDQPGCYERDFQTERKMYWNAEKNQLEFGHAKKDAMPLSRRYYLADAVFVAAIQAETDILHKYASALVHPVFPLYLGRRSCPPSGKVLLDLLEEVDLVQALRTVPWQASEWYSRRQPQTVELEIMRDEVLGDEAEERHETVRDVPLSFSSVKRDYAWRTMVRETLEIKNPYVQETVEHDPWTTLEEE